MAEQNLPEGWATARLVEVAELLFGQSPPSSTYNQEGKGLPFFQGKAEFGATYPTVRVWCTEPTRVAEKDDILISVRAPVGPTNLAPYECAIGRGLAAIRPKIERDFIRYYLKHIEHDLAGKGTGTTFAAITKSVLQNQLVVIAPLNEQRRIVSRIEELFSDLEQGEAALRRVQKLLGSYRQAVLKAAVTGELTREWRAANQHGQEAGEALLQRILAARRAQWTGRGTYKEPQGPNTEGLPPLPEGWVWATPDQLADPIPNSLCIGPFGSNLKVEDYRSEGVPLVFVRHIRAKIFNNLNPQFVSPEKAQELSSHKVSGGDLLITKMGDPPGDICIYPLGAPVAIITADCIRFRPSQSFLNTEFLELAIGSQLVQQQIVGITKGVAQQKITLANFKKVASPLPSQEEQVEISNIVRDIFSRIDALEAWCKTELTRSATLRQSILKAAFAGQLVPQDPADEPASALLARIQAARAAADSGPKKAARRKPKAKTSRRETA